MRIIVNGDPMELSEGTHLPQLLEQLKLKPELVVVELNLNILKREELARAGLKEGDQVEIVHFVGGGSSGKKSKPPAVRPGFLWKRGRIGGDGKSPPMGPMALAGLGSPEGKTGRGFPLREGRTAYKVGHLSNAEWLRRPHA